VAEGPQCHTDERKIPAAACDKAIPATECLAWHVQGVVPGAKLYDNGRSCRLRCPNHDDGKPSLVISVGDNAPLMWHCHACGPDARLAIRYKLVEVYGIGLKHLPMTRKERAEQEEMVFAVFASRFAVSTKMVCHQGYPRGNARAAAEREDARRPRGACERFREVRVPRGRRGRRGFTGPPVRITPSRVSQHRRSHERFATQDLCQSAVSANFGSEGPLGLLPNWQCFQPA